MDSRKFIVILLLAIFIITCIRTVGSCSCSPVHPQTDYCNADYVIIARILRKSNRNNSNSEAYKIEIKKTYKMSETAHHFFRKGKILTPKYDSMCGVAFKTGKLYVIAGRGPIINLCNYVKEYKTMSVVERRGFAGAYKKGCPCSVRLCFNENCEHSNDSCQWSPWAKCETEFSTCVPFFSAHENLTDQPRKCHWRRNQFYKACLSDL